MKTSFSARVFDSSHLHAPMARPAIASRFTCTVSMNLGAHLKRLSSNAASGQASPRAQASESLWVKRSGALLFSGAALYTASLSYWQLERYQWKLGLIEERTKRLEDKPVTITSLLPVGDDNSCFPLPESLEYRKVLCIGKFDHANQVLLGPRSAPPASGHGTPVPAGAPSATGWDVVTPLVCKDGRRVLVNRGWVNREQVHAITHPEGEQQLLGILKGGEKGNRFTVNNVDEGHFVWLDLSTMAAATGSKPILIYQQQEEKSIGPIKWPIARPPGSFAEFYVQPMTHLTYAATWACLSALGGCITYLRFLR